MNTSTRASQDGVMIVGAGPVGLVLACELARRDVSVRIIDKLPTPTDESRAALIHARSLEMFDRMGVVDEIVDSGLRTNRFVFSDRERTLAEVPTGQVDSSFPFSVTLAQPETERILTDRLSQLGVSIERGTELLSLEQDDTQVRYVLEKPGGGSQLGSCDWIIGADGARSVVRAQTGQELAGSFHGERFVIGDVEANFDVPGDAVCTLFSDHGGPLMVFPMRGGRVRIIVQVDKDTPIAAATLPFVQAIIDERSPGVDIRCAHWLTAFDVHHAQVPHYRTGRAFLAGDAAHVHSPAGGQGMNTGMQDAFNLGWKLADVVHGIGNEALLDSYHTERHPVAAQVIERSTTITNVGTLRHRLPQAMRNAAMSMVLQHVGTQRALASWTEETDINYRKSPIVTGMATDRLHPGDHAPDVAGTPLRENLNVLSSDWAVLTFGELDVPIEAALADLPRIVIVNNADDKPTRSACDIRTIDDSEGRIAHRYGSVAGDYFLIRPDGYIGHVGHRSRADAVGADRERLGI